MAGSSFRPSNQPQVAFELDERYVVEKSLVLVLACGPEEAGLLCLLIQCAFLHSYVAFCSLILLYFTILEK